MPTVILDGETVNFEGVSPQTPQEVWDLVSGFLGQSGRIVSEFLVDAEDWRPDMGEGNDSCERIQITSSGKEEVLREASANVIDRSQSAIEAVDAFSCRILSQDWTKTIKDSQELVDQLRPILEIASAIGTYSKESAMACSEEVESTVQALSQSISGWMDSLQSGDVVKLSDISMDEVKHALAEFSERLQLGFLGELSNV